MKLQTQMRKATLIGPVRGLLASIAVVLLGACASPGGRGGSATSDSPSAPVDREERMRQLQDAEALYLSGRYKEAQAAFEQLTRTYPRNGEMWFRYGNTLMKLGDYDNAASAMQNAIAFDPGQGRAALNLGLVRLAQAQAAFEIARARLPDASPERKQADGLQYQIQTLMGAPHGDAPAH